VILCIVKEDKRVIAFDKSYMTFPELTSSIKPSDNYYVISQVDGILYSANLSLILNRCPSTINTWDLFETYLTTGLLTGAVKRSPRINYVWSKQGEKIVSIAPPIETTTNIIYRSSNSAAIYPFDTYNDIVADYGSRINPGVRNISGLRSMLTDVIFRKVNPTNTLDFNNTIPIINGMCIAPVVYNEELYAPYGTNYLLKEENKNILLMDLSPLGDIEIVRLKDCTPNTSPVFNFLEIILPITHSLANKSVILVLGGRMFFQDELYIPSDRLISISLKQHNIHNVLISNRIWVKDYDTPYTMTKSNLSYYINTQIWDTNDYNNFIVIIDNPNVKTSEYSISESFQRSLLEKSNNLFTIDKNNSKQGFVIRLSNRDIIDYTWIKKRSRDLIMFTPTPNIVIPDEDIGYIETSAVKTYGNRVVDSGYVYKNIFSVDS